ncbi:hypothetical protein HQ560_22025 [bacterium]|nr:hypothetical protein [bacterium]
MAKKAKKKAKKAAAVEVLVVGSKVRGYIRGKEAMMSGELLGALNCVVIEALDKAIARAQANKRATVKPQDL